jgi:leader peptidase (prepilin peptidase)/N-methyltransferase
MMSDPLAIATIAASPFIGSFLGTLVVRVPEGRAFVAGRSICEACGQTLRPRELVPIVSWLVQGGRCAHCGAKLSWFYPGIEIAALAVALIAAIETHGAVFVVSCLLGWLLLVRGAMHLRTDLTSESVAAAALSFCIWAVWLLVLALSR